MPARTRSATTTTGTTTATAVVPAVESPPLPLLLSDPGVLRVAPPDEVEAVCVVTLVVPGMVAEIVGVTRTVVAAPEFEPEDITTTEVDTTTVADTDGEMVVVEVVTGGTEVDDWMDVEVELDSIDEVEDDVERIEVEELMRVEEEDSDGVVAEMVELEEDMASGSRTKVTVPEYLNLATSAFVICCCEMLRKL